MKTNKSDKSKTPRAPRNLYLQAETERLEIINHVREYRIKQLEEEVERYVKADEENMEMLKELRDHLEDKYNNFTSVPNEEWRHTQKEVKRLKQGNQVLLQRLSSCSALCRVFLYYEILRWVLIQVGT